MAITRVCPHALDTPAVAHELRAVDEELKARVDDVGGTERELPREQRHVARDAIIWSHALDLIVRHVGKVAVVDRSDDLLVPVAAKRRNDIRQELVERSQSKNGDNILQQ